MTVTFSPVLGAAGQLFDDNGNPLSGGKIYTYNAGTTTPLETYTTVSGQITHTNPIVLDAVGRIPAGGEIWLTTGIGYKFILKDSNDVLIGTYDNIPSSAQPPAANDADSIMYEQGYTVSAGNFVVGKTYRILSLGNTNFTLIGATANIIGLHFIATGVGSGTGTAEISQTVETKLRESVSLKDFGAIGDGITDDTVAVDAAFSYIEANPGMALYVPPGTYLCDSWTTKIIDSDFVMYGTVGKKCIFYGNDIDFLSLKKNTDIRNIGFQNMRRALTFSASTTINEKLNIEGCYFEDVNAGIEDYNDSYGWKNANVRNNTFVNFRPSVVNPDNMIAIRLAPKHLEQFSITDNFIDNISLITGAPISVFGIFVGQNFDTLTYVIRGVIHGNNISNIVTPGHNVSTPEIHGIIAYGENIVISNNNLIRIGTIAGSGGGNSACEAMYTKARYAIVTGNTIRGTTGNTAMNIKGSRPTAPPLALNGGPYGYDTTVSNNTIIEMVNSDDPGDELPGNLNAGIALPQDRILVTNNYVVGRDTDSNCTAIRGTLCSKLVIEGNYALNCRSMVSLNFCEDNIVVKNNVFKGNPDNTQIQDIIYIESPNDSINCENWIIDGNVIVDPGNPGGSTFGINVLLRATDTNNDLIIQNNYLKNFPLTMYGIRISSVAPAQFTRPRLINNSVLAIRRQDILNLYRDGGGSPVDYLVSYGNSSAQCENFTHFTWEPLVKGNVVAGSPTYDTKEGRYYFISDGIIYIQGTIKLTGKGGMTGSLNFYNFPYTFDNPLNKGFNIEYMAYFTKANTQAFYTRYRDSSDDFQIDTVSSVTGVPTFGGLEAGDITDDFEISFSGIMQVAP